MTREARHLSIDMWANNELKYMDLNDKRLVDRLGIMLESFANQPATSIPKACQSIAETKGVYRFFSNEDVEAQKIRKGFRQATIDRMLEHPVVYFLSDATNLVYTAHKSLKGIGVLRNFKARGLNLHTTFVVTPEELPLGVVDQMCWGRKEKDYGKRNQRASLPIESKESYRWLQAFRSAQESLDESIQGVFMGDRGADIFELFMEPRKPNMNILIRAAHDRRTADRTTTIFQDLARQDIAGKMKVKIKRSGTRKERIADLAIRFQTIQLPPPLHKRKLGLEPININIVLATEITEGVDIKDVIHWKLITTLPIDSLEAAISAVQTYATRWLIERYHYTLKQGCKVQELQLEDAERIDRAIATYTIVAWRLMFLTYFSRIDPNKPCTTILSENEWKALHCFINKTAKAPTEPPTVRQAIRMIAKMGGFLGRKNDGEPGIKVIWQGLQSLAGAAQMYSILKNQDVGNG